MESLFSRTYKYRQRENKSNLENYLIEILAFCLQEDLVFRALFFNSINEDSVENIKLSTQTSYEKYGRPDIEITGNDLTILIECKVDAKERENQLADYSTILSKKKSKRKILIYLSKFYEAKDINKEGVKFLNIKWRNIYLIIDKSCSPITQQLQFFLIEKNIAMDKNFKTLDLLSLENIASTISKMDEVIDSIKGPFEKKFGKLSKESSRSTRLKHGAYFNYKSIGSSHKFNIDIGFMWWWEDKHTYLAFRLWIPFKENEKDELIAFMEEKLEKWEIHKYSDCVTIGNYINIHEFILEEEQTPLMTSFLLENINQLSKLKTKNPKFFK